MSDAGVDAAGRARRVRLTVGVLLAGIALLLGLFVRQFVAPERLDPRWLRDHGAVLFDTPRPLARQQLQDQDGHAFDGSGFAGRWNVLFFGFTHCPDVCPTTLAEMKLVMEKLGDTGRDVQVVFVSVDPDRDTSEKMQTYVEHFNPSFLGLSGTIQELEPVWNDYSITREAVESDSAFGVIINHTARVFLVDPQGNMRLTFAYQTPVEDIVHDIRLVLEQEQ